MVMSRGVPNVAIVLNHESFEPLTPKIIGSRTPASSGYLKKKLEE